MRDHVRRSMPLFPMRIVTQLTELTPRQIRYYEEQNLICPSRTEGNQRLFSFHDVDRLLQIKDWLEKGLNIAGIKEILHQADQRKCTKEEIEKLEKEISEKQYRQMARQEFLPPAYPGRTHLIQGELTRFFRH